MKCELCKCEMVIDKIIEKSSGNETIYKCRNNNCGKFGFNSYFVENKQKIPELSVI
ncbi:MAG: hypothetical protein RSF81_08070 [Oscillospiraceae bacterium]